MSSTSVKTFASTDPGASALSGTAGSQLAIVKTCLVDGRGAGAVATLVVAAGIATANYAAGHPFAVGSVGLFAGATPAELNGEKRILTASTTAVTFAAPGIADGAATGSITSKLAAAGWTELYPGTANVLALKPSVPEATGCVVRLDDSSAQNARVRAYEQSPGTNLIIGDSRLAHFDMDLVDSLTGQSWQNLAFGGASLKECVDLANYVLDSGNQVDRILFELSFYTLNSSYNTDRFSALEATLRNPLAYCLNLEYNVNALTVFMDTVKGTPDTIESGDWTAADYLDDAGNTIPLHKKLYEYPALITTRCQNWTLNETELAEFLAMAQRCADRGVELTIVLPPMAANVRTEVCDAFGITAVMQDEVLPLLEKQNFTVLNYEWGTSCITDDDTQFFDGFHLDEKYGLPDWTAELFDDMQR